MFGSEFADDRTSRERTRFQTQTMNLGEPLIPTECSGEVLAYLDALDWQRSEVSDDNSAD
jgi:hypothetical protein